jgi:FRG domain
MATRKRKKATSRRSTTEQTGPGCRIYPKPIINLGEFFNICSGVLREDTEFWFRGHPDITWTLTPSALRYDTVLKRQKALDLLADFRRYVRIKLPNVPTGDDVLEWVQLARHYGLPTRLLDWTANAAVALYFSCQPSGRETDADGGVLILNQVDLNRNTDPRNPRIFDAHTDADRITEFLRLRAGKNPKGPKTIAINPVWNSERIVLQQGAFTLHGSREFTLTSRQVPSLICLRVPAETKQKLLGQLDRAGINEMSIFPEPEHMCRYLVWRRKLDVLGAK